MMFITLPNLITIARALMIPVIAYLLALRLFDEALILFALCAVGDLTDGYLARRWNQRTRFGAIADPLADKLTMLTVTLMLAAEGQLPGWLAVAVITRDIVIVFGALAFHFLIHEYEMSPTRLSKLNTAIEFIVLTAVLIHAAEWLDLSGILSPAYVLVASTIAASGLHYVWVWGLRARQSLRG